MRGSWCLGTKVCVVKIGYLGPEGTFSEAALRRYAPNEEAVPFVDVLTALESVRTGVVDAAVVPMENSVEGGVNATIDSLSLGEPLVVVGEILLPITFALGRPTHFDGDVRRIGTHPHAWAQCKNWIHETLPEAEHVITTSTAAAAAELAAGTAEFDAALCSALSAEKYGLRAIATEIADNRNAVTRFIVVARPSRLPEPTGADKTTLMVHLGHNEAGGLLEMLEQFAVRGVNLSRIESRPIGDALGRYAFSIDAEGHVAEDRLQAVLIGLHRVCPEVRFLGSYPSADGRRPILRAGTSDSDFAAAREWVSSILDQEGEPIGFTSVPFGKAPDGPLSALVPDFDHADAKTRIKTAALREFYRYGYDGASMRRIASAARSDPGLIPYHFGGKAQLFRTAVGDFIPDADEIARHLDPSDEATTLRVVSEFCSTEGSGARAAVVALIRTALSPSARQDAMQPEAAQWIRQAVRNVLEKSSDPIGSQALYRLIVGLALLTDIMPITPLAQLGCAETGRLVLARIQLLDRSAPFDEYPEATAAWQADQEQDPEEVSGDLPARERILASAIDLFAEWGGNQASLRELARRANCDISLVHYYFGSKTGLLSTVLEQLDQPDDQIPQDSSERLRAFIALFTRPEHRKAVRALLLSAANPGSAAVAELVRNRLQALFDEYLGTCERGDIGLGFHVAAAEVLGSLVLAESLNAYGAPLPHAETGALANTLLEGARAGASLEQLAERKRG